MFTALIRDVSRQFGLGTRVAALVNELLRFIARTPGGLAGFLALFEAAGMGLLASSWLGNSESEPISAGRLEGALGADALRRIGRKVGLSPGTVGPGAGVPDSQGDRPADTKRRGSGGPAGRGERAAVRLDAEVAPIWLGISCSCAVLEIRPFEVPFALRDGRLV
jgi:hypothetical protein